MKRFFKNIIDWFTWKKDLIDRLNLLEDLVNTQFNLFLSAAQELDQTKTYLINNKNMGVKEAQCVKLMLEKARNSSKFSLPTFIVLTGDFEVRERKDKR